MIAVKLTCQNCGMNLVIKDKVAFCPYCGTELILDDVNRTYTHNYNYTHTERDESRLKESENKNNKFE